MNVYFNKIDTAFSSIAQRTSTVWRSYKSNQLHLMKDTSGLSVLHSGRRVEQADSSPSCLIQIYMKQSWTSKWWY